MAVKIPPLLHKMSLASQKAWYKKHGMEMPSAPAADGKSAAQAKKDVGEINKKKAREAAIAAAATASKKNKELVSSSERVRMMRKNADMFGGGLGGGLERNRDIVNFVRSGGYIKAGRLGEEAVDEAVVKTKEVNKQKLKNYVRGLGTKAVIAGKVPFDQVHSPLRAGRKVLKQEEAKPDASMAMTHTLKMKAMSDKDKKTLGKVAALMAAQKKKIKEEFESIDEVTKKEAEQTLGGPVKEKPTMPPGKQPAGYRYVRGLARKAMKAGLKKEEVEQIDEGFNKSSPAHMKARDLVSRSSMKAVYHSDGSATIHATGDENVSSATKVDHIHRDAGLDHNKPASAYKNSTKNKGGLTFKTKESDGSHQVHISYKGIKEEVELTEAPKDAADVGEYDYEGDMAKSQLRSILANAKRLHDMLEDKDNLPEWVQSKITLAEDYIVTAANYMEGEMNEEVELDEASYSAKAARAGKDIGKPGKMFAKIAASAAKRYGSEEKGKKVAGAVLAKLRKEDVEQVEEAEGKVAVTPKEKELAAHHGDPNKITYGDVIKARLKSAAAKKMGKE